MILYIIIFINITWSTWDFYFDIKYSKTHLFSSNCPNHCDRAKTCFFLGGGSFSAFMLHCYISSKSKLSFCYLHLYSQITFISASWQGFIHSFKNLFNVHFALLVIKSSKEISRNVQFLNEIRRLTNRDTLNTQETNLSGIICILKGKHI